MVLNSSFVTPRATSRQLNVQLHVCSPCLHGRGFICKRIAFDAVTPSVYMAPIETVTETESF